MWKLKNPLPFLAFAFVAVTTTWKTKHKKIDYNVIQ
jgi:hypothetical protein